MWRVVRVVEGAALEMLCTQVPRVRIPNSPPSRVFITDSSCEHSIFLFQLYFRAGVMPALFVCYGQFFMPGYFSRYIQPQLPVLCRLGNTPIHFRSAVFRDSLQIGSKLQFSAFCIFPFPAFRKQRFCLSVL